MRATATTVSDRVRRDTQGNTGIRGDRRRDYGRPGRGACGIAGSLAALRLGPQ